MASRAVSYTLRDEESGFIELDYKSIGIRIKEERSRLKLSQEQLAGRAGISTTHMSHIETGNTKLSLPVLHKISWALGVSPDVLICDSIVKAKTIFESELLYYTQDCDETEIRIIADTIISLKNSLRKREFRAY